ncbi:MAG TPA: hypothetical protein PLN33_18980, partial [Hyphomonadaceae bacterium]|nr:hypothetical protein [Hyphomonadaceae bacterium]
PDIKEGVYFGEELGEDDPRVKAGLPLHGANLFPSGVPELQTAVTDFMDQSARSAHAIMEGIALSLGLDAQYFGAPTPPARPCSSASFTIPPPTLQKAGALANIPTTAYSPCWLRTTRAVCR